MPFINFEMKTITVCEIRKIQQSTLYYIIIEFADNLLATYLKQSFSDQTKLSQEIFPLPV